MKSNFLPFTNCLAINQAVASWVNADLRLDKITRQSRHVRELRHFLENNFAVSRKTRNVYRFCRKVELNSTLCNNFSAHPATEQLDLLHDRFGSWVVNAQHRYSTRFAATLQNKLHVFAVRFTVLLKLEKMAQDFSPYSKTKKANRDERRGK